MNDSLAGSASHGQCRPVDPLKLKSKARLRLELETSGLPQKAFAYGVNASEAQMSRYLNDQSPDDVPSYKIPYVVRELGPGYMEWLAIQCGGSYHHGESHLANHQPIPVLIGLLARQSGSTIQQIVQDLTDRRWSLRERQADLPGLRKLQAIVGTLIQEAEEGGR